MQNIRRVFRLDAFRTGIYKWHHEVRDVDFEVLRQHVNYYIPYPEWIRHDGFLVLFTEYVRESPDGATLGPQGVARMRWTTLMEDREEHLPGWQLKKWKMKSGGSPPPSPPLSNSLHLSDLCIGDEFNIEEEGSLHLSDLPTTDDIEEEGNLV